MAKLPILFLAPTLGMANAAKHVARGLGIDIAVEIAEDEITPDIVDRYAESTEVIVSRGGIAEIARRLVQDRISIVEITMSINDLLTLVCNLAQRDITRIGIVSRTNLFDGLAGDFHIGATQIAFHPCRSEEEIESVVIGLHKQGIEAIIGCRQAYRVAVQCGVYAIFLESSDISIRKALEEAVRLIRAKEREKFQAVQLTAIINNIEEGIVAIDNDKRVSFHNSPAQKIFAGNKGRPDFSPVMELLGGVKGEQIVSVNGNSFLAHVIPLKVADQKQGEVITFQETRKIQASETKIRISAHQRGLYAKSTFGDIVGKSTALHELIDKAKAYSGYDSNLLIHGETGTGKEIFAQSIHNHGRRKNGPFVSVNTASIPPSLLESELFGYAEGAFTGARKGGKPGLFELAHGGTIFLDEIGELAPEIQSRLLRVLQEKEIMRIGDDKIMPVDVRILCATNRNLFEQVRQGKFREDLYYRIHVLGLRLLPLRERSEDVLPLVKHFLRQFPHADGHAIRIDPDAAKMLRSHSWPGNTRQLRNVVEVMAHGNTPEITAHDIAAILAGQEHAAQSGRRLTIPETGTLKQIEASVIQSLLARYPQDEVCRRLGVSRVTLWRKIQAHGNVHEAR